MDLACVSVWDRIALDLQLSESNKHASGRVLLNSEERKIVPAAASRCTAYFRASFTASFHDVWKQRIWKAIRNLSFWLFWSNEHTNATSDHRYSRAVTVWRVR